MFNLRDIYRNNSKASRYLLGFENKHEQAIYAALMTWEQAAPFIADDMTAANEDGERYPCIRYKVGRGLRDKLEASRLPDWTPVMTWRICSAADLRNLAAARGVNLGEAFEEYACAALKLKRNTNTTEAWYDGPDAWAEDGEPLQIGYEGKTFTYTAQVERMGWA